MRNDDEISDLLRKMYELQQEQFAEYKRVTSGILGFYQFWRRVLVLAAIVVLGGAAAIGYVVYKAANQPPPAHQRR